MMENQPYSGGYITQKYSDDPKIEAMQLELCYRLYIDNRDFENEESPAVNRECFDSPQRLLREFFGEFLRSLSTQTTASNRA